MTEAIERREYDAADLMRLHAPRMTHPNKRIVFLIACPDHKLAGHVSYSRWPELPLPDTVDAQKSIALTSVKDGFFDYEPPAATTPPTVEWHLNFADPNLFYAYGGGMSAQDELQVAEHPVLACVLEALKAEGRTTRTVVAGRPTPVLVMGAERRARIRSDRRAEKGGPSWLYGRAFAEADPAVVHASTTRIDPPTISNILAIAAPLGGRGRYRPDEIRLALSTAYSGFRAAVLESRHTAGPDAPTVVHSGFWGCGAFGGNRVMMVMLQLVAAEMTGLDALVLHVGDSSGREDVERAVETLTGVAPSGPLETADLLARIGGLGLEWRRSDGN
jgi:Poly (ADP-ribose) glycohydrolase (PARG), Macro domain fold